MCSFWFAVFSCFPRGHRSRGSFVFRPLSAFLLVGAYVCAFLCLSSSLASSEPTGMLCIAFLCALLFYRGVFVGFVFTDVYFRCEVQCHSASKDNLMTSVLSSFCSLRCAQDVEATVGRRVSGIFRLHAHTYVYIYVYIYILMTSPLPPLPPFPS